MKSLRSLVAASLAASVLAVAGFASDLSGNWQWTAEGRNGPVEVKATLLLKDGVLTGSVAGRQGNAAIGDASFKDGMVAFTVTSEFNGRRMVTKYAGKLESDTITGTIERPGRGGASTIKTEWKAIRAD
jgi:hypothetical protein